MLRLLYGNDWLLLVEGLCGGADGNVGDRLTCVGPVEIVSLIVPLALHFLDVGIVFVCGLDYFGGLARFFGELQGVESHRGSHHAVLGADRSVRTGRALGHRVV